MAAQDKFKIIPYYTGIETLEDVIRLPMASQERYLVQAFRMVFN